MKIFDKILELASIYSLETHDVVEALRSATLESIHLAADEDIEAYYVDNKLIFNVRKIAKKSIEMGSDSAAAEERRILDITKPAVYAKIVKKFQDRLDEMAQQTKLFNILDFMANGSGVCKGEIIGSNKNGYFIKTHYGEGYMPSHQQVEKEAISGLYKVGRELEFSIEKAYDTGDKINIILSRRSAKLAKFIVFRDFSKESVLFDVKRKCGFYTKIYHDARTKPSANMTKQLRYIFGGERIIYRAS